MADPVDPSGTKPDNSGIFEDLKKLAQQSGVSGEDILKTLERVKGYFESAGKSAIGFANDVKRGLQAGKSLLESVEGAAKKIAEISFYSFVDNLEDALSQTGSIIEGTGKFAINALNKLKDKINESGANTIAMKLGISDTEFKGLVDGITGMTTVGISLISDPEILKLATAEKLTSGLTKTIADGLSGIVKMEGEYTKLNETVISFADSSINAYSGLTGAGKTAGQTLTNIRSEYAVMAADAVNEFGMSVDNLNAEMQVLGAHLPNIDIIKNLKLEDGTRSVTGFSAAMAIAKGTGLDMGTVGQALSQITREMGTSAEDAAKHFDVLARAAADTSLSTKEVADAVMASASGFRFLGDNVDGSAAVMRGFLRALGDGRAKVAEETFKTMASHISQIVNSNTGLKAFLGTMSGIGGGRGALGSSLAVEEAFTTGEGLEEVIAGFKEQIENLSGTSILTRREAMDTGQETQYEIQRQLMAQFLGVSGTQADLLAEALQKGMPSKEDLQTITGRGAEADRPSRLLATAQEKITAETGMAQSIINKLEAMSKLTISNEMASQVANSASSMQIASSSFAESATSLLRGIRKIPGPGISSEDRGKLREQAAEEAKKALESGEKMPSINAIDSATVTRATGASRPGDISRAQELARTGAVSAQVLDALNLSLRTGSMPATQGDDEYSRFRRTGGLNISGISPVSPMMPFSAPAIRLQSEGGPRINERIDNNTKAVVSEHTRQKESAPQAPVPVQVSLEPAEVKVKVEVKADGSSVAEVVKTELRRRDDIASGRRN